MQGDDLSTVGAVTGSTAVTETPRDQTLGRDEFLKLLIAQLQNQDPLSPEDPSKFVSELAQFSNLEQLISIREVVDNLAAAGTGRGVLDAAPLIGREVLAAGDRIEIDPDGHGQLAYDLPRAASRGELRVLDVNDRLVSTQTLGPAELSSGRHRLELAFEPESVSAGVYRYVLDVSAGDEALTPISYIAGTATGARAASLGGEVNLLIGAIEAPLSDTFEVGVAR